MKSLIFDLDQTLIDSRHIEYLRRSRKWSMVYRKIPNILAYDGINEVLSITRDNGIKLAIVSSSPLSYVQRVVRHFEWSFDFTVCYHDTTQHKPHPAPFIEAADRLKIAAMDCWAIGDDPKDVLQRGLQVCMQLLRFGAQPTRNLWKARNRILYLKP